MKSDKEEGEPSPFFFRLAVSRAFLLLTERLEKANSQHVGWVFVGGIVFFSTRSLFVVANNRLKHSIKKVSSTACVRIYTMWFLCCTIQGYRWKTTYILMTLPPHSQCLIIPELVISSSRQSWLFQRQSRYPRAPRARDILYTFNTDTVEKE